MDKPKRFAALKIKAVKAPAIALPGGRRKYGKSRFAKLSTAGRERDE